MMHGPADTAGLIIAGPSRYCLTQQPLNPQIAAAVPIGGCPRGSGCS